MKLYKYLALATLLLQEVSCTQKQAQVVAGGLVYISMFRRPLLGSLNQLWQFIESFRGYPPVIKLPIPAGVRLEICRFACLMPLAKLNFRLLVRQWMMRWSGLGPLDILKQQLFSLALVRRVKE